MTQREQPLGPCLVGRYKLGGTTVCVIRKKEPASCPTWVLSHSLPTDHLQVCSWNGIFTNYDDWKGPTYQRQAKRPIFQRDFGNYKCISLTSVFDSSRADCFKGGLGGFRKASGEVWGGSLWFFTKQPSQMNRSGFLQLNDGIYCQLLGQNRGPVFKVILKRGHW